MANGNNNDDGNCHATFDDDYEKNCKVVVESWNNILDVQDND